MRHHVCLLGSALLCSGLEVLFVRSHEAAAQSLSDLQGLSGIGATKLERYGDEVLRVST